MREVIEQYDQLVGSRTVRRPGLDAAVLRLRPSLRGLAVSLQGPAPGEIDRFRAGVQAVLGAARNVACAGGEPIGLTDCLNFGNPEKPEIAHELAQAIEGIAQAAEALGIPVVSGNVSLYNETDGARSRRRRSSAASGSCPTSAACPAAGRRGDAVLLATSPDGSLAAEAALIRSSGRQRRTCSLCHDVGAAGSRRARGSGGVEPASRRTSSSPPNGSRHGAAILASAGAREPARLAWLRPDRAGASSHVRRLRRLRARPRRRAR